MVSEVRRFVTKARQNGAWYESVDAKDYDALALELAHAAKTCAEQQQRAERAEARLAEAKEKAARAESYIK